MPFGLQKVQKTVGTSQQQQRSSKNPFCILIFQLAADLFFHYLVGMQVIFFYTSRDPKYFIALQFICNKPVIYWPMLLKIFLGPFEV